MVMISRSQSCELRKDSEKVPGSIPGATTFCFSFAELQILHIFLFLSLSFLFPFFPYLILVGFWDERVYSTVKIVALRDVVVSWGSGLGGIYFRLERCGG